MIQIIVGPPYDPINSRIIPIFFLYLFLFPVSFILAAKLIKKGIQQQLNAAKFLGISFVFYGIGVLIAFLGLLEVIITSEFRELYRLSLPLGYSAGIMGNICLLYFGFELFGMRKKISILFNLWAVITLILVNLDSNWYGVPHYFYTGYFSLRIYSSLNMTVFACAVLFYLIHKIKSLSIKDPMKTFGFRLINWSMGSFLLFWGCMTLDALNILIYGEGFSIFTLIAWLFALGFWFLSYFGLLMPPKFRKLIENKIVLPNYPSITE